MLKDFRKIRIGFGNFLMLGNFEKEVEDAAVKHSDNAKAYLEKNFDAEIISSLPVITDLEEARAEWNHFREKNIDAMVIYNGSFSLSNLMIDMIRNLDVPFLLWGLEEYFIDKGVLSGSMIGAMPAGMIFRDLEKKFVFAYGNIQRKEAEQKVRVFMNTIRAMAYMREARIGLIGSRPDGFEIAGFDELAIKRLFGTTINKVSISDLLEKIDCMDQNRVEEDMKIQEELFEIDPKDIEDAKELSKVYLALKDIIKDHSLDAYAPQCWPELRMIRKTPMCPANGRLTAEGIMGSCEADMDCTLTMLMLHSLNGNTPWTADFVNIIDSNDSLMFWHCGNASYNLSEEKPKIEVVFEGPAQTAVLKPGKVTICRLNHHGNDFELFAGVGEAIKSKPMLKGSNSFIRMPYGNMEFVESMLENGVPHHVVLIHGDVGEELEAFARLLGIKSVIHR